MPDLSESAQEELVVGRADLLFTSDGAGHLIGANEPGEPDESQTPRVYICVGRNSVSARQSVGLRGTELFPVTEALERLGTRSRLSVPQVIETIRLAAADHGLQLRAQVGPAYIVPDASEPAPGIVEVHADNRSVLLLHFPLAARYLETLSPCMASLAEGIAVCTCRSVRRSSSALEAGVDTVVGNRREGRGTAAVRAWARRVWETGKVPCYSAYWENRESISLAGRLTMIQFAVDVSLY